MWRGYGIGLESVDNAGERRKFSTPSLENELTWRDK